MSRFIDGFSVANQTVYVDFDFQNCSLTGWTEISIVPSTQTLETITLDCRQTNIHSVSINGQDVQYIYNNPCRSLHLSKHTTVFQHHFLRNALASVCGDDPGKELSIKVPRGLVTARSSSATARTLDTRSSRHSPDPDAGTTHFEPLLVRIEYSLVNPLDGISFAQCTGASSSAYPHVYTTNDPIACSTSLWTPCIDGIWERCTWELKFSIPRTVSDIFKPATSTSAPSSPGSPSSLDSAMHISTNYEPIIDKQDPTSLRPTSTQHQKTGKGPDPTDSESLEMSIICSGDIVEEYAHPTDYRKKIVSCIVGSAVGAQHIAFAIGPFQKFDLSQLEDKEDVGENSEETDINAYFLPGNEHLVKNTCLFLPEAMRFISDNYGSYPFTDFKLCFVRDAVNDCVAATGLALCSERILFPQDVIDPIYHRTKQITTAVANQWCGINIIPKNWGDYWITIGISSFIASAFMRQLTGKNEHRFRLRKESDKMLELDIGKPPLAYPNFNRPLLAKSLEFMQLKAPAVLHILDRRMTKISGSYNLSRVIPKLFLQGMSGELFNGMLSTGHFARTCERVGHMKLDAFFKSWVYNSGYPIFRVTQRFNKKKMFVEMGIRQVQLSEVPPPTIDEEEFVEDSRNHLKGFSGVPIQPVFPGPMTIRIHEADGTPYEHIVDIREGFTKLDIQYNTKYKRLKRVKKQRDKQVQVNLENSDEVQVATEVLLHSLGDVLQTDEDIEEWKLHDWTKEDEDRMNSEAFEWIRLDADFEWIGRIYISQPDYMFLSQLQQDRDVIAHYEAVQYFANRASQNSGESGRIYSSILVRTLMDVRYYYGVRMEAASALAKYATSNLDYIGSFHLMKAYQTLYCFENSTIPRENDFSNFASYFVQKAIIQALSTVRDENGDTPLDIKKFLLDLLKFNENSNNAYSDCYFIGELIVNICNAAQSPNSSNSLLSKSKDKSKAAIKSNGIDEMTNGSDIAMDDFAMDFEFDFPDSNEHQDFLENFVQLIEKNLRMDRWSPSYGNIVTVLGLQAKETLEMNGMIATDLKELLDYCHPDVESVVRRQALRSLLTLGGVKMPGVIRYVFATMALDNSGFVRQSAMDALHRATGHIALKGSIDAQKAVDRDLVMIIEERADIAIGTRRENLARAGIAGALAMVRRELGELKFLQEQVWDMLQSGLLGLKLECQLLDLSAALYPAKDSLMVKLRVPSELRLVATRREGGLIVISRESRLKTISDKQESNELTETTKKAKKSKIKLSVGKKSSPKKVGGAKPVNGGLSKLVKLKVPKHFLLEEEDGDAGLFDADGEDDLELSDVPESPGDVRAEPESVTATTGPEPNVVTPAPKIKIKLKGF
ncbi:hypothetical protein CANCADRAFT_92684 [Tortispora caseinolytica NRRL Y-17796]|uniref:Transcription initiation factor TFIID subunit 2 n=1 Tax=Tortispora caseinolytica NRRL Y-17796 TaxID=767744 RepID=A0A1E4TLW3_9ASCO|nr:hypothetical protein CANCADRAFT_92684 [Tortispora caseinolytica NRRL Y-17796]